MFPSVKQEFWACGGESENDKTLQHMPTPSESLRTPDITVIVRDIDCSVYNLVHCKIDCRSSPDSDLRGYQ